MKKKQWIVYVVAGALLLALALWAAVHIKFDWSTFFSQVRHVEWKHIALGVALIWLAYVLRAARWAILLKPQKKVSARSLLGSQVIGFTAVALFGRLADLVRPYLIARRTRLQLSSQIAVYTVERMFDGGSMALIFSSVLLLVPDRATLPHHEFLQRMALTGIAGTVCLGVVAIWVRASGAAAARLVERSFSRLSPKLGHSIGNKILSFRDGLDAIQSWSDFFSAFAASLVMWAMITVAYVLTLHAFVLSPALSSMTLGGCMVLMAASMVSSAFQLPVIFWFTQIAVIAGFMRTLFNIAPEPALGCSAMLLIVTFLSVIPLGLIWARFEHVSLKQVSEQSEHLAEEQSQEAVAASEA